MSGARGGQFTKRAPFFFCGENDDGYIKFETHTPRPPHLPSIKEEEEAIELTRKKESAAGPQQGSNNKPNKNLWFSSSTELSLSVDYTVGGWGKRSKSFFLITPISHGRRGIFSRLFSKKSPTQYAVNLNSMKFCASQV